MVSRTRLVPLVLMVTLLLALVAISARGRPLGTRAGSGGALPFSFWDYVYTTIVIVVVPLFIAGLIAAAMVRRRQRKPRNTWQSLLRMLLFYCIFLGLELLLIRHLHLRPLPIHQPPQTQADLVRGGTSASHHHSASQKHSLAFRWDELAIILGLLVVVAAILVMRSRRRDQQPHETAPEALAAALDESLADLSTDGDVRRAIIAAYARMERALAAAGIPRHPAETPLEYVERALLSLDTSAAAVRRLTELFEWARFSHHEPEPSMRDEAVDALNAVRDELRAAEPTPA